MQEQWIQWMPAEGLSKKYSIMSITGNIEGFLMTLSSDDQENKGIRLVFKRTPDSYQRTEVDFMGERITHIRQQYGDAFLKEWTFFKILNSEYARWVSDQSYEFLPVERLIHFVLVGTNAIVDLITPYEPSVIFFEKSLESVDN